MAGAPPPPPGFRIIDQPEPAAPSFGAGVPPPPPGFNLVPTGEAHDGDTFRLNTGQNGRLFGVDAFELKQQGMQHGNLVPLGKEARDALIPYLLANPTVTATGAQTYGRPVVSVDAAGDDVAQALLNQGMALATPQYLKGSPLLTDYMEAERGARLNRRGAFAGQFQNPADYRKGKPDPWAQPEWQDAPTPGSRAVFFDDPTPFQGLRPEIAEGYQKIWTDPKSTPDDLLAYAKANGFIIDPETTRKSYAERAKRGADPTIRYAAEPPRLLTNQGDGAIGAGVRGLSDPINMLDEMGGVVDSLGLTPGRENVWDSDRRFADILANNIDQNRSVLAYDDANHPYARFGGQLASGLMLPGASVEGVGLAAARQALRAGGSRFVAKEAAQAAARLRLAQAGAIEGGFAGFGAGEGGVVDRLPSAGVGALTGGALGYGTGALAQELGPVAQRVIAQLRGQDAADAIPSPNPGSDIPSPPPGFRISMENVGVMPSPSISSPRLVDRIDVNAGPRPLLDPATEMQRRAMAERVNPADLLPLPSNVVASQEEAASIGAGLYPTIKAPNEASALESRMLPRGDDPARTMPKRGPADLVTFLRSQGGVIDQGGELRALGVTDNAGRDLDFARGEQRFGRLVDNENGMPLDQAADLAWRSGYFPDHAERPTIGEFLDAVDNTNRGVNRSFRPDDLAEVDAFNAARDQRFAVERARDRGTPLAEDRGQPVSMDDLEANQPPLSAYEEWGDQAPDFAGNIRLSKLDSPQSIQRALSQVDRMTGGFDAARRGRITQAETQSLADELGMTLDQLLSRRKGQAFNAEEALAARQILAKSGNELVNMARRIQRMDDPGEEALSAFRQALVRHVAIQEQIAGATAEAGRTLAQFRMVADGRNVRGGVLNALAQGGGGSGRLKEAADLILENADTPQRLNRAAQNATNPKFIDKVNELWINSLLSGPATHVVNAVSNTMTALAQIPEHGVAAGIGGMRKLASRGVADDRVLFTEVGARSVGLLQGIREGLRQAWRTLRTGEESDFANKIEARTQEAIPGIAGKIIRTPTRMLSSADELYKGIARRMELNGLAVRQAAAEGLRGEDGKRRAAELVANPTDEMLDKAFDYGRYVTFQRPLGEGMQGISRGINALPGLKFIVPFVRTPTNLLKFAVERSPAAPLLKEWRADMLAGGVRRDLALAKVMVGSGVGALAAELAAQGLITGNGPADEKAAQLLRADGWQPYSIKVGDRYYSYSRLDPFATTLGVAAGMVELQDYMTEKQQDEVANLLTASVIQNLSSKTWLSGMSGLIEAINDPARYADNWLERLAGSMAVPAGVAQVARTVDPTIREAEGILDAVRARGPWASQALPARRDIWGKPIILEGGLGPDLISPSRVSTQKHDPVTAGLLADNIHISKPNRTVGGERLSAEKWDRFQQLRGEELHRRVAELLASSEWKALDKDGKQDMVTKASRASTEVAKALLNGVGAGSIPPPPPGFSIPPPPPGFTLAQ
ncbi:MULTISPECIES: thermonuclease family protein [unclassified Sphingobium]|uniref:thermonuclease family protein n=1 Tax=unclassified Sphingobium TaxID=2611147 RepID=UPI001305180D|nr:MULTISPECIES: thermonuclease family protein [unclassified Sphingobium]